LEYIGTSSLDGPWLGVEGIYDPRGALDRSDAFDPKVGTIVRVQIHRFREKLSRYYLEEAARMIS
jgi:hypothetical protein